MKLFRFVIYTILIFATISESQWVACPFNAKCECMPYEDVLLADCMFVPVFPIFLKYNDTPIGAITVAGTFPTVPNNAFYNLQSLTKAQILITNDKAIRRNLTIEDEAFATLNPAYISQVTLSHWNQPGIPTAALTNRTFNLYISQGDMQIIEGYAFNGFTTSIVEIRENNVLSIQPNAFTGLTFSGNPLDTKISLAGNGLTSISSAFKNISVSQLVLSFNNISEINDFAFSPNDILSYLDLSFNPVTNISSNTVFANLPGLKKLNLNHTHLSSVPTSSLSPVTSLESLDLSSNRITVIDVNSFYNLKSLKELILDENPIVQMIAGCLNGMNSLTELSLNRLDNLSNVDVLITYGALSLQQLRLNNCSILQNVDISDVTKLPASLHQINLRSNDIREINENLQIWLSIESSNIIDISLNSNYSCQTSIQWMAKYVICQPIQIVAELTYCAGTNELLTSYLAKFDPGCD